MMNRIWAPSVGIAALAMASAAGAADAGPKVRHGYTDSQYGELHYAIAKPVGGGTQKTPLVMFHQTANSSVEFGNLVPEMGKDRVTIAIDTPGYGGSDGPDKIPTIEDYAVAMATGLKALGYGPDKPVDVLGYHTGAFTAGELAIVHAKMIRRVVLVGEWIVPEERRLKAIANLPRYETSVAFFDWLAASLPRYKESALVKAIGDANWGRVFVDSLRPLTRREHGHDAAFEYAVRVRDRLPKIEQPVLLVAIDDGIREPTLEAKKFIKNGELADLPHLKGDAFFNHAPELGGVLRKFLDSVKTAQK